MEIDGRRGHVLQAHLSTAIETPGTASQAAWEERAAKVSKAMDDAGHKQGAALRGGGGTAKIDAGSLSHTHTHTHTTPPR